MPTLDAARTALIVIDPQNWTMGMPISPHPADQVVANVVSLAKAVRSAGGVVCLTRAAFSPGYADMLRVPVDIALPVPEGGISPQALAFRPEVEALQADIVLTQRQWSAFYGTELDLQLRRRGIGTIVIAGVMTNFGVESTARDAGSTTTPPSSPRTPAPASTPRCIASRSRKFCRAWHASGPPQRSRPPAATAWSCDL